MSSKQLKQFLKEARDAVKSKDYPKAISNCQLVLEHDASNYMALVLLGAAYQDSDREKSAVYLKRALPLTTEPTVVLQGLSNCVNSSELPEICEKLLVLSGDKYADLHPKLTQSVVDDERNASKVFEVLKSEFKSDDENRSKSAIKYLAPVLLKVKDISDDDAELFVKSLQVGLAENGSNEMWRRLLRQLYKMKQWQTVLDEAFAMHLKYDWDAYPLEWICKVCTDESAKYLDGTLMFSELGRCSESLLTIKPHSALGMHANGLVLFQMGELLQSRDCLLQCSELDANSNCNRLLELIYLKCCAYEAVERIYKQTKVRCKQFALCLSEQNNFDKAQESITICRELMETAEKGDQTDLLMILAKCLITTEQWEPFNKVLFKLKETARTPVDSAAALLLESFQLLASNQPRDALRLMKPAEMPEELELDYQFLMGRCLFAMEQYEEAFVAFAKCVQLQPTHSDAFYYIGQAYIIAEDVVRARKAWERCVRLNPTHKNAVIFLSQIYRENQEWELNANILNAASGCHWARTQLGLHYLSLSQFDDAVVSFRAALRAFPNDLTCWENLADAYFHRGSFTSAMRAYQRTIELEPSRRWPKFQAANIKVVLKMFVEALDEFQNILAEDPKYLPALKSKAEGHLGMANYLLEQRLIGRCRDHLQMAADTLTTAIKLQPEIACLWRLFANVIEMVTTDLPKKISFLELHSELVGKIGSNKVTLNGFQLADLAAKFYGRAIKIRPNDHLLWRELAGNYYKRSQKCDEDSVDRFLSLAFATAKYAIQMDPLLWQNWNVLGVISMRMNNPKLAQHSFIRAIMLEKKSKTSWSNLGFLYLKYNRLELANKAFGKAQQSNTEFTEAWVGQALIAEQMGVGDEAVDLFRHCTQLKFNAEGAIGYAHWVASLLSDVNSLKDPRFLYQIKNMYGLAVASDSIGWFCDGDESDYRAFILKGYLLVRQGLYRSAVHAYKSAIADLQTSRRDDVASILDQVLCNLGYCHLKLENLHSAIDAFSKVTTDTLRSRIGLALAYFKDDNHAESYPIYENTLESYASTEWEKAHILVAMAAMVYAVNGETDAKTVLFQCISLPSRPAAALFSACALGILHEDLNLSELVLKELKSYEEDSHLAHHVAFLTSQFHSARGHSKDALIYLLKVVHRHPDWPKLRRILAEFLLRERSFKREERFLRGAAQMAQSTIAMEQKHDGKNVKTSSVDSAKLLALASEAMRFVDQKRRRVLAQSAVHLNPTCKQAWATVIMCTN